ncbi:MAG: right-handed parallel beta-helix repeat-containing protein [Candidatus Thermoplasmatota archaeon]|nr:right-handed parallel beta-helix repeat-containing protein [Candidatus Thermoplasmatota archaeon]
MSDRPVMKSKALVLILILSTMAALVAPASTVSAQNTTSSGYIDSIETWSGTHTVSGDIIISPGAKLIIEPSTQITFSNGTSLEARGNLCVGAASCGASQDATSSSRITMTWLEPSNASAKGDCRGMTFGTSTLSIDDPSCGEGIIIRSTIDLSETALRQLDIDSAWGVPFPVPTVNQFRYGALVLQGASPELVELEFTDTNTSSVLATELAQPRFVGGLYTVGNDQQSGVTGNAVQIYGGGTGSIPIVFENSDFVSTERGCRNQDNGRSAVWVEESFAEFVNINVISGDFGLSYRSSAGKVSNSSLSVNCNGVDINGMITVGAKEYPTNISNNIISTVEGTPITAYAGSLAEIHNNDLSGASGGSGIAVQSSRAIIHGNNIGPIGGWNGLWLIGSFDVDAQNNTISDIAREPVIAGDYWAGDNPDVRRLYFANNQVSTPGTGSCQSNTHWGGEFTCPVVMVHRAGATLVDNVFTAGGTADGIRATGALLNVQRNTWNLNAAGAVIQNFDTGAAGAQQYGSLAFFTDNQWNGVTSTYDVTKSSVTVQSETIPNAADGEVPVRLAWDDQEAWPGVVDNDNDGIPDGDWDTNIVPHQTKSCAICPDYTPRDFPLALNMDNNSTVFTFSNVLNLNLSKIQIATQPTFYSVQVKRAEMVRFQAIAKGSAVPGANILIEDGVGNDLYSLETLDDGRTPWIALPSNSHLDFRGLQGGDNPDGFADDEYEDSCSDGVDNDGDLLYDTQDDSCDYSIGSREMSKYFVTGYKFGSGYYHYDFLLQESTYEGTVVLENDAPSIGVDESSDTSFKRTVTITGSAWDGEWIGVYPSAEESMWAQKGYVHRVEVKDPFTGSWDDAGVATDTSGMAAGEVTGTNHPFRTWEYSLDMSSYPEDDYVFEIRSFDGLDYSEIITKTVKLNTQPPLVSISEPADSTTHRNDDKKIIFSGTANDDYGCPTNCGADIQDVFFVIEGSEYYSDTPADATWSGDTWTYEWSYAALPRILDDYTFTIWASDSDFCVGVVDECNPVTLTLTIDNENRNPLIQLSQPVDGTYVEASENTVISGVAQDPDGLVNRIDIEIRDPIDSIVIDTITLTGSEIDGNYWSTQWDSGNLQHDRPYTIFARSFDGIGYSQWDQIEFIADNPPNKDNNRPVFDNTDWKQEFTLYCDAENPDLLDRCTFATIDLNDHFSDPDVDQDIILAVVDDQHAIGIRIDSSGIATYDPDVMAFYTTDMSEWTMENVVFIAQDVFGSKVQSDPVDFIVIPTVFSVNAPDQTSLGSGDKGILFDGTGIPGRAVTAYIDSNPANSTVVKDDSTWELLIPSNRIIGAVTPQFTMGVGTPIDGSTISDGSGDGDGLPLGLIGGLVLLIAILVATGARFIEFGEEEGIQDDDQTEGQRYVKDPDNPGWLWDVEAGEWVIEGKN